ncbi:hypothetical protein ACIBI3_02640 [Actinomadura luteofluorescens]|uniref:phosphoribosyltransferase-like protein n=1 Tax=Actinomadura luteofluorescens TaxID=46163 RepID=UPI00348AFDC0
MSVIDTAEYAEWLTNFPLQYQPTAELLVNALHYLDESTFRSELTEQLVSDLTSGAIMPPALIVPVRTGSEMGHKGGQRAVIFENVWPHNAISADRPGSEALCANIIRNLQKGRASDLGLVPVPRTLEDLRVRRVRSLVLAGDYAGSGSQVIEAAKIWTRNPTIRSWRSYGLVDIHVVVHSAAGVAVEAVNRAADIDCFSMVRIAPDFDSAEWTAEQRVDVELLCAKFARHRDRGSLGWNGSAGLFIMQHTTPNNLPEILWQTKGGVSERRDGWYPLFPNRRLPESLTAAFAARNEKMSDRPVGERAGLGKIIGPALSPVLFALRRGLRTPEQISAFSDISLADSKRMLEDLVSGGYADRRGYLTDQGIRLLESGVQRMSRFRLDGSDENYYPQRLRRVGDV